MNHNYNFTNVNDALPRLMGDLLLKGQVFGSRAGKTTELTHVGITLDKPWQREIVIPTRKANVAAQIVETMWVLSGRNDVAGLSPYLPRAADFSDDGIGWRAGYGPRIRSYHGVDQLAYVVDTLADNPNSRQAVINLWDATVDTTPGKDIACNNWLSFSSRNGKLDLMVGIRSNDAMWGWSGINAFEWSAVIELVACLTGLEMGKLHFATTSFHLYEQHWQKASLLSVIEGNFLYTDSPQMTLDGVTVLDRFDELAQDWFGLEEDIRFGRQLESTAVDVDNFPDPMLRSWLRVLQWYWSGDVSFLKSLERTRLHQACVMGLTPPGKPQQEQLTIDTPNEVPPAAYMIEHVNRLHAEKHAAYGDSWKRRGEYMILANIARKVDRIESGKDTADETQADTAQDLMVYLAKYRCWLEGGSGDPVEVAPVLRKLIGCADGHGNITELFERLENARGPEFKIAIVNGLLTQAYNLALSLWR